MPLISQNNNGSKSLSLEMGIRKLDQTHNPKTSSVPLWPTGDLLQPFDDEVKDSIFHKQTMTLKWAPGTLN